MKVHGRDERPVVHGSLYLDCSDLPASRKVSGLRGHSSVKWMCPLCNAYLWDIMFPEGFDLNSEY